MHTKRRHKELGQLARTAVKRQIISELLEVEPICFYCSATLTPETATLDHYLPVALGRSYARDRNNIVLACEWCNNRKADKLPGAGIAPGPLAQLLSLKRELETA